MSRATGRHTRPKKLNAKQNVQIFREEQVELIDYDAIRGNIETGVEKNEESEYHLQQAIKASQTGAADSKVKDGYIPTPPTVTSKADYDQLYQKGYHHPATYIRSSSTVEDCAGTSYCMDDDDDVALKEINASLPAQQPACTDDQFEDVMSFFEETAQTKQPYAAVDNPPVLPLEELEEQYDDTIPVYVKTYAKYIYDHWRTRRGASGNRGLSPRLKFETGQDTDDADPYVCFRRRELRQIRKTRNRDAQSAEKLRKLRLEFENARTLLLYIKTREIRKKEQLETDRKVFEMRMEAKKLKRGLGIKGDKADDEDFVNQKPSKQPRPGHFSPRDAAQLQQLRIPIGRGGADETLRTQEEHQAQKDEMVMKDVQNNIDKHIRWNEGYVDKTAAPITPVVESPLPDRSMDFRQAMPATEYLPTPPASISDEENPDVEMRDVEVKEESRAPTPFRYASPAEDTLGKTAPSFRRRIGRGGRLLVDRRIPFRPKGTQYVLDKFRFDDSDEENMSSDDTDPYDSFYMMQHRAHLLGRVRDSEAAQAQAHADRRAQVENSRSNQQATTS